MKIILVRESGDSKAIRLSRRFAVAGLFLGLLGFAGTSSYLYGYVSADQVDAETIDQWRDRIAAQDERVREIESQSTAESEAVGRQLAQMQARLWRMEALGARVTEVAEIDAGEFSFNTPAPQGGPTSATEKILPWPDLRANLDALAYEIRDRESELEILESLLVDQEYRETVELTGRPVKWGWTSSPFGKRVDPFSGKMGWHAGVDFAGRDGSDIIAVASGVVVFAGPRSGFGEMVEINHGDGYITRYAHHKDVHVAVGDIVKKGVTIGSMGSSGRSTGPHVHFEVLKNGRHVDPAKYVARRRT